jgi:hypothetical protein
MWARNPVDLDCCCTARQRLPRWATTGFTFMRYLVFVLDSAFTRGVRLRQAASGSGLPRHGATLFFYFAGLSNSVLLITPPCQGEPLTNRH